MLSTPSLIATIDVVALAFEDNEIKVALWKRQSKPFQDELALPGVIINGLMPDHSLEDALSRTMEDRLGVKDTVTHLEQVGTVGGQDRDPRGWSISTVYLAFVSSTEANESVHWMPLGTLMDESTVLPFDHKMLIDMAVKRFGYKSTYTSLPLLLLPKEGFTIRDVSTIYSYILDTSVKDITIRKRIEFLEKAGYVNKGELKAQGRGRPTRSYQHNGKIHEFDRAITS